MFAKKILILLCCSSMVCVPGFAGTQPSGMVVTSRDLATRVGADILKQGGNAVDAAVAIGYALAVVEPCCGNLGGGGFMLLRMANGQSRFVNFREKAPFLASAERYLDKDGKVIPEKITSGWLSVAVPGTVMGLNMALEKYGTLPLATVIAPAIRLAREGFILDTLDVARIRDSWELLQKDPAVRALFMRNGKLLAPGDRLVQRNLANTLETIARGGTRAFYAGPIADALVADSQKHGGLLTRRDFLEYTVDITHPLVCGYRGYTVITSTPPGGGGVVLCEMLSILSGYALADKGYGTPDAIHDILEAMRYAYRDRQQLGDPDFVLNPVDKLLSRQHALEVRGQIRPDRAGDSLHMQLQGAPVSEKAHTTHYSVVDKAGNAVSVTYTLNGYFGAKVIGEPTGIFLNNEMDDFTVQQGQANKFGLVQGQANAIAPQKRPLSSMTPTIVLKANRLFMVLGAPGGSTIPTQVLATLLGVLDFGKDLKTAVNAPRYHMQWLPDVVFFEEDAFSAETRKTLEAMGYRFQPGSPWHAPEWGAVAAIIRDEKTGELTGVIDRRRPAGLALAVPE